LLTIACLVDEVILGVDTHRDLHAAVVLDALGRLIASETFPATRRGARALLDWARRHGTLRRAGVEGTGSFGAGLTRALRAEGIEVIEVTRAARVGGRHRGKNDTRDAEAAARNVLSGQATAEPKARDGLVESIRVLRNTRASAVKARTQAILHLKNLIVTATDELRETPTGLSNKQLVERCARMHRTPLTSSLHATRLAMRSLARRHCDLDDEIAELDKLLAALVARAAPRLLKQPGIGPEIAARLLLIAGDDPTRLRNDAALAALCGASPDRGLQRQDHPTPPQPRRRPPGQQRAVADRQQPHDPRRAHPPLRRPPHRRRQRHQRDPPLPHAPHRSQHLPPPRRRPPRRPNAIDLDIGASTR
jgi:transposase